MKPKHANSMTDNLAKEFTGSEWFGATGTFKPSLPQVPECATKDEPRFKSNKELTAFIRAKLAKQNG